MSGEPLGGCRGNPGGRDTSTAPELVRTPLGKPNWGKNKNKNIKTNTKTKTKTGRQAGDARGGGVELVQAEGGGGAEGAARARGGVLGVHEGSRYR